MVVVKALKKAGVDVDGWFDVALDCDSWKLVISNI